MTESEGKSGGIAAFTIEEIVALFNHIDEQILELHRCSSDDFLGLNAKFKGFYKEAKGISTSAGALFLLFSEGANRKLISELEDFYESLVRSQIALSKLMDGSLSSMKAMRKAATGLYLPLRNLSQNGGTLSLLLANLSLSHKHSLKKAGFPEERIKQIASRVDDFVSISLLSIKMLQRLSTRLDAAQAEIAQLRDTALRGVEMVIDDVHYGLILFAEKHEESQIRIPQITSKTDSCSKSIAGIITNLQYQDIIRQKMEHIQSAHQDLMEELEALKTQEDSESDYWIRMLVQIRDISALQSAQLVATNREYQAAIETIAKHFRDIAQDMETVASLCQDSLRATSESGNATAITDLLDRLKRSGATLGNLSSCVPTFRADLHDLVELLARVSELTETRKERFHAVCHSVRTLHASLLPMGNSDNLSDLLGQLSSVLEDLEGFEQTVLQQSDDLLAQQADLIKHEGQLEEEMPLWSGFGQGAVRMHGIALGLAQTERESTELLGRIQAMSKKVSNDTHQALEGIRYYDFFEHVIDDIINGLNTLSAQIKQEINADVSADIERLRGFYTMRSEHSIHNAFSETRGEGDVDLFGGGIIDNEEMEANEDDDGLELF